MILPQFGNKCAVYLYFMTLYYKLIMCQSIFFWWNLILIWLKKFQVCWIVFLWIQWIWMQNFQLWWDFLYSRLFNIIVCVCLHSWDKPCTKWSDRSGSTPRILILFLGHKIRLQVRFCEHEIRKNVKIPQVYYPWNWVISKS